MTNKTGAITRKVELIKRSARRMEDGLGLPDQALGVSFMKRESWLHLRRSVELLFLLTTIRH